MSARTSVRINSIPLLQETSRDLSWDSHADRGATHAFANPTMLSQRVHGARR